MQPCVDSLATLFLFTRGCGSDLRENSAAPTLEFGAGGDLPLGSSDVHKAAQAAAVALFRPGCPPAAGGVLGEHGGVAQRARSEASALLADGGPWERVSAVGQSAGRQMVGSPRCQGKKSRFVKMP